MKHDRKKHAKPPSEKPEPFPGSHMMTREQADTTLALLTKRRALRKSIDASRQYARSVAGGDCPGEKVRATAGIAEMHADTALRLLDEYTPPPGEPDPTGDAGDGYHQPTAMLCADHVESYMADASPETHATLQRIEAELRGIDGWWERHAESGRGPVAVAKDCEECGGPQVHTTLCPKCDPERCPTCGGDGSVRELGVEGVGRTDGALMGGDLK